MTKITNSKPVLVIEYWNLKFVCNFSFGVPTLWAGPQFGVWNLGFHNFHHSNGDLLEQGYLSAAIPK
jgi:hypothetical protein